MSTVKVKIQAPDVDAINARTDEMIRYGYTFKDYKGNPWFLPTPGGGYMVNAKCEATREEFDAGFRAYLNIK